MAISPEKDTNPSSIWVPVGTNLPLFLTIPTNAAEPVPWLNALRKWFIFPKKVSMVFLVARCFLPPNCLIASIDCPIVACSDAGLNSPENISCFGVNISCLWIVNASVSITLVSCSAYSSLVSECGVPSMV